jgi:cytochrome c
VLVVSARPGTRGRPVAAALAVLAVAAATGGCWRDDRDFRAEARALTQGGDAAQGHALIKQFGCGSCHVIPGIDGARGTVGPSLETFRERAYVAGVVPHTPENLIRWIQDPPAIDSLTAMPRLGVSQSQARDIAAYLYALER